MLMTLKEIDVEGALLRRFQTRIVAVQKIVEDLGLQDQIIAIRLRQSNHDVPEIQCNINGFRNVTVANLLEQLHRPPLNRRFN